MLSPFSLCQALPHLSAKIREDLRPGGRPTAWGVGKGLRFGVTEKPKVWGVISRYNILLYILGVSDVIIAVLFGKWKVKKIEEGPSILKMNRLLLNCQLPTLGYIQSAEEKHQRQFVAKLRRVPLTQHVKYVKMSE